MGAFILTKGGSPQKARKPTGCTGGLLERSGLDRPGAPRYRLTQTRCAAYSAQRRLRRKSSGSRWPVVVVT